MGQSNFCGQSYCFPSGWCHLEGSGLPEKDGSAVCRMTKHRDSGDCSFSSLPRANSPKLSSQVSSPLCPPSARAQGNWLQTDFAHLPFKSLSASPAVFSWQTETLMLFTDGCYLGSFPCFGLGNQALGLCPILLRRKTPVTEISLQDFCCLLWEPSQPSYIGSALPTSLVVVMWLLPSVCVIKLPSTQSENFTDLQRVFTSTQLSIDKHNHERKESSLARKHVPLVGKELLKLIRIRPGVILIPHQAVKPQGLSHTKNI